MYKKAWCTCKVVVLLIKPIVFFLTFSLRSASLDLKVPVILTTTAFTSTKNYVNRSTFTTRIASGARSLLTRLPVIGHLLVNHRLNICAYDLNS